MITQLFDAFAAVLDYPAEDHAERRGLLGRLATKPPADEAGEDLDDAVGVEVGLFLEKTRDLSRAQLEELYTRTFDINPITNLEIGWHLYGEAYERGAFLVRMRELLRNHGIPESTELPDHCIHVLRLVGRMEPDEARGFALDILLPAIRKMVEGFAGQSSPYEHVLRALTILLEQMRSQGVPAHD